MALSLEAGSLEPDAHPLTELIVPKVQATGLKVVTLSVLIIVAAYMVRLADTPVATAALSAKGMM